MRRVELFVFMRKTPPTADLFGLTRSTTTQQHSDSIIEYYKYNNKIVATYMIIIIIIFNISCNTAYDFLSTLYMGYRWPLGRRVRGYNNNIRT